MRAPLYDDETVLVERTARATGTRVLLVYNYGADPEQPWETICAEHGGVCSHETRRLAESFLPVPAEWCEDCAYGPGTLDGARDVESPVDVLLVETGDSAEAPTPYDALVAAVTLRAEAKAAGTFTDRRATVRFLVDGRMAAETRDAISVPAR